MKNINIAALLILVFGMTISSCKKDPFDEKRNASMNIHPSAQTTDTKGEFSIQKGISSKDISNVEKDSDWEKIIDITLKSSQFRLESENLKPDYIIKLDMSCTNVSESYSKTITVQSLDNTKSGIDFGMSKDTEYASFMEQVFKELKSGKTLDFKIQGTATDNQESPVANANIKITIDNRLEIKVREFGMD